ncbi:hypothetical protein BH24BAC1_BH24BAC1_24810 [soil metagenome]
MIYTCALGKGQNWIWKKIVQKIKGRTSIFTYYFKTKPFCPYSHSCTFCGSRSYKKTT